MIRWPLVALLLVSLPSYAGDSRYCGDPKREANGKILRSSLKIAEFKREHPCPANGARAGACPGWAIDHVVPLVCGGCDDVFNMQWLPNQIKSAAGIYPKDRWEQRVYCKG